MGRAVAAAGVKAISVALFLLGALEGGCSDAPRLIPRPVRLTLGQQIKRATVVVVAVSREGFQVGPVFKWGSFPMSLRKVRIEVENVLKGAVPTGPLEFFYYAPEGAWDGSPFNLIGPNERSVYFLVRDIGVLRAVTDVYPSHIVVRTGRHSALPQPSSSLPQTIAGLLVLPGQDVDLAVYADPLYRAEYQAEDLVGEAETARLLREVLGSRNGAVRSHACLALAEVFREGTCLAEVIRDSAVPAGDRARARGLAGNN